MLNCKQNIFIKEDTVYVSRWASSSRMDHCTCSFLDVNWGVTVFCSSVDVLGAWCHISLLLSCIRLSGVGRASALHLIMCRRHLENWRTHRNLQIWETWSSFQKKSGSKFQLRGVRSLLVVRKWLISFFSPDVQPNTKFRIPKILSGHFFLFEFSMKW